MIKIFLLLSIFISLSFAKSFHFSEVRYSDALDKSRELHGLISFGKESLKIAYEADKTTLLYEDEELTMFKDTEEVTLDESEAMKISQYFAIILLLYEGDTDKVNELFSISKIEDETLLLPKEEMQEYIQKIVLVRREGELKSLQLYLTNDDNIKISIEDEVH